MDVPRDRSPCEHIYCPPSPSTPPTGAGMAGGTPGSVVSLGLCCPSVWTGGALRRRQHPEKALMDTALGAPTHSWVVCLWPLQLW